MMALHLPIQKTHSTNDCCAQISCQVTEAGHYRQVWQFFPVVSNIISTAVILVTRMTNGKSGWAGSHLAPHAVSSDL